MRRSFLCVTCFVLSIAGQGVAGGMPEDEAQAASGKLKLVSFNEDGEKRVLVGQGQVTLVEIAADHVNRVVTPFEAPEVWTSSAAEIRTSGGVLYVKPADEMPVSLFITETGREEFAINISLVPRSVPPVELHLDLDARVARVLEAAYAQEAAMASQTAQTGQVVGVQSASVQPVAAREPWFETIKSVLTAMARGDVPRGYAPSAAGRSPECLTGFGFEAGFGDAQYYRGQRFEVVIGRAINTGPPGSFKEFWCAGEDVAAVALWPSAQLASGAQAEILILRHLGGPGRARPVRTPPSLIGG
ncbi:MAG: type-F conjugative transfer system secretin TraK [Pseudomonadota bacterium]